MTEHDDRMAAFEKRLDAIGDDLRRLRVLYEHHDSQIRTIAEVQVRDGGKLDEHGRLLREIKQELVPLGDLHDFVRRIAGDHEDRISALEKHTGIQ
jgi:hypothetical protein